MKGKLTKQILSVMMVMIFALSLWGCGNENQNAVGTDSQTIGDNDEGEQTELTKKDSVTLAVGSEFANLAPNGIAAGSTSAVTDAVYARLFNARAVDGEYVMDVATSVVQDDETHITIEIRDDVYDELGNHLTASDVMFSLELAKNGLSYYPRCVAYIDFENSEVISETTLQLVLSEPTVLQYPLLRCINLVTKAGYEASSDEMITDVVATGAYRIEDMVAGTKATLVARDNWHGEAPQIKSVDVKVISEEAQMTNALETGEIDIAASLPVSDVDYLSGLGTVDVIETGTLNMWTLMFNCSSGRALDSTEARQAVAYATDRDAMIALALGGFGEKTVSGVTQKFLDYDVAWEDYNAATEGYYEVNLEKASQLAENSGLKDKTLEIVYSSSLAQYKTIVEMLQQQLNQIGVKSNLTIFDDAVYNDYIQSEDSNWDICVQYCGNSAGYAIGYINNFFVNFNQIHAEGDLYDTISTWTTEALSMSDDAERTEKTNDLVEFITNEVPAYGISTDSNIKACSSNLHIELLSDTCVWLEKCYWNK